MTSLMIRAFCVIQYSSIYINLQYFFVVIYLIIINNWNDGDILKISAEVSYYFIYWCLFMLGFMNYLLRNTFVEDLSMYDSLRRYTNRNLTLSAHSIDIANYFLENMCFKFFFTKFMKTIVFLNGVMPRTVHMRVGEKSVSIKLI